jgi:hypothetical protein
MPSIGQTWVLASIGAVVEMGILSTLKRLLMACMEARVNMASSKVALQIWNNIWCPICLEEYEKHDIV